MVCFCSPRRSCVVLRHSSPLSHGNPRVDDRRVIRGIVFVIKNGLRWRDALRDYGPHKTIYNRFVRWSRLCVFDKTFAEWARKASKPQRLMIDATHLKAHRAAASLLKRGYSQRYRVHERRLELKIACRLRWQRPTIDYASQRTPDERLQRRSLYAERSSTRQRTTRRQRI